MFLPFVGKILPWVGWIGNDNLATLILNVIFHLIDDTEQCSKQIQFTIIGMGGKRSDYDGNGLVIAISFKHDIPVTF